MTWRGSHWDLMLESEHHLLSWALEVNLFASPRQWVEALPLEPHDLKYLRYEGPLSGQKGHVKRLVQGEFAVVPGTGELESFEILNPPELHGRLEIRTRHGNPSSNSKRVIEIRYVPATAGSSA